MSLDERVQIRLRTATRFGDIRFLESVDSTNRHLIDLAASGAPEGLVVYADHQTAGRGRMGRRWDAPPGAALLVSVLLRPVDLAPERLHLVTAAVALAARDACVELAGFRPDLKWPNDLLVGDRKLAGILATAAPGWVVVGMGMNLSAAPEGAVAAADLAGRPVRRDGLLVALLEGLERWVVDWERVAAAYRRDCATVGRPVRVQLTDATLTGRAVAVDADGRLVVGTAHGEVRVAAGDVVHLRPDADRASGSDGPADR